jgi:type II secretory pathway pseudopilin PulG
MQPKRETAGFTLVEMLAILASLLLPALSAAKAKAQSAHCKSNLRQIAIGQSLYVTDFGAYPFSDGDWFSLLRPYSAQIGPDFDYQDTPHLWCPSARYGGPETQHQFFDYGYNAWGLELHWMGLDDNWSLDDPTNKPVREADVVKPANMIAFSDSAAKFLGEKRLTLGLSWIGTAGKFEVPGIPNGAFPPTRG